MRVLAIDPGTTESAWVIWDGQQILAKGHDLNTCLLSRIENCDWDGAYGGACMAVEWIESMGMAVGKETFETVFWVGRFWQASSMTNHRVTRRQVKLHLCGQTRAKDKNVRQALLDKLGLPGTKKNPGPTYGVSSHLWSALAVAVTFLESPECQQ